ncbi:MAG: glycosyltransferase [Gammaproteobacteria bacterium]|nr:glycosyltransferase [Gammaproteobacteria bacterium]
MKRLPAIQSLWIGDALSNVEKLCIQSFLDHGHEFHLYTYADVGGIPEGTVNKDANEILPASEIFKRPGEDIRGLADYFRYALLAERGGWWVDMDLICLKSFDFDDAIIFVEEFEGDMHYQNAVLRFPPQHPLMVFMRDLCADKLDKQSHGHGMLGGQRILSQHIRDFGLEKHAKPLLQFVMLQDTPLLAFNNTFRQGLHFPANAHSIHLGNMFLDRVNIDKNAQYDPESLFEQLKSKHRVAQMPGAKTIDSAALNKQVSDAYHAGIAKHNNTVRDKKRIRAAALAAIAVLSVSLLICIT